MKLVWFLNNKNDWIWKWRFLIHQERRCQKLHILRNPRTPKHEKEKLKNAYKEKEKEKLKNAYKPLSLTCVYFIFFVSMDKILKKLMTFHAQGLG